MEHTASNAFLTLSRAIILKSSRPWIRYALPSALALAKRQRHLLSGVTRRRDGASAIVSG